MPATLFVVQRVEPHEFCRGHEWLTDNSGEIVKAFLSRDQAEFFRREWERPERLRHNPFQHGGELSDYTSMKPSIFRDWLLDVDLQPPPVKENKAEVWRKWWDDQSPRMTEQQRDHVWEGLDTAHLLKIVELEFRD
jgi:hypothetical protein